MNLKTVHHVAIIVSNYEVSKEFYLKLGFQIKRENRRSKDWKLDLELDGCELEIFAPDEMPPKRVTGPEAAGLRHLAFRVKSVEEIVAELAAVGIECEPIRYDDLCGGHFTFFKDPDGLPLELHE